MNDPGTLKSLSNQPVERRSWFAKAFDLCLPPDCVLCRRAAGTRRFCDGCYNSLPWARSGCRICAAELPDGGVCGKCLTRPPAFDATVAAFAYTSPVDRLIQSFKYGHDLAVGRALGRQMADRSQGLSFDRIIPVPLHRRRLAHRGFNQSVILARAIARAHGANVDLSTATRTRETPPQAGLKLKERRRNLRRAFEVGGQMEGETVLVVDDVMTSGATLDCFAEALKGAGATRVVNLVCARTPDGR